MHDRISRGPTDEFAVETSDLYRKLLELLPDPSRADSLDTKPTVDALRFLASASRVLGSSLNYHNTLANVARLAVPYIADWCVVDIVNEDGLIQRVAAAHANPAKEAWARDMDRRYPPKHDGATGLVLRTRESHLVPEVTDEMLVAAAVDADHLMILRRLGMRSVMTVPLMARDRVLGAMTFVAAESGRQFGPDDLALAEDLAQRSAMAVDNARLYQLAESARAEAEMQRAHLHALFMQAPALIAVFRGPNHVFELVNPGFSEFLGERDFIGQSIRDVVPDVADQGIFNLLDQVYTTGEQFVGNEAPISVNRPDGALHHGFFNFVLQPLRGTGGEVEGVMVHAVDVAEQVRARQRVEQLAAEREAILGQMAEGLALADADGRVIFRNAAAIRMSAAAPLGMAVEEYAGPFHVATIDGHPYPPDQMPLARAVRGETVIDTTWRISRGDGVDVVFQGSAAPVLAEDGSMLGAVATFRDVTSQFELEREKDNFLSAAAHDLKTPLASIKGLAQILSRRAARSGAIDLPSLIDGLKQIDTTATRMASLVTELLDVTRLQMDRPLDLNPHTADLVALTREAVTEQQRGTESHRLILQTSESELVGTWDGARLTRVLTNLLSNAIKFSPAGGLVRVTLERAEGEAGTEAVLSVTDEGLGIPEADIPHIFERFYRAGNVKSQISGTGIGLAGSQRIVEQHGGTIAVESREGSGSTFTVRLPLAIPE
ncbi:MAG: hypothetical protein NVS2B16_07640 [Chloroflexota bacterium]